MAYDAGGFQVDLQSLFLNLERFTFSIMNYISVLIGQVNGFVLFCLKSLRHQRHR